MRVKVFGHNFKSKAELALLLGVSTRYSPRNTKGVNVPVKDVLSEKDIMERFGFKSKKEARMWLANLINEAGHGFPPPILQTNNFMRFDADQVIAWYQTQIDKTANLN